MPGLKAALGDPGPDNRLKAIKALEFYTPEDVEGDMRAALEDDSAPVRLAALKYLASYGASGIADILIKAGKDEDGDIRKTALEALCRTEGGEAAGALVDYYRGGDAAARYYAFGCLKDRQDPASRALMADSLKDKEAGIRLMAVNVLGMSGDIKPLYPLALDTDQDVKRAALGFMKKKPEPGMLDVLEKSVEDSDKGIRLMSLDVLGGIDGPDSGRLISGAVDDPSSGVRDAARKLVSVRSDEGVVSGLISMLGENSQPVRDEAARLLVTLRGGSVDGVIAAAFPEVKPLARQGMLDVLSTRSPEKVYPLIIAALGDGDPGVRQAAVRAAGKLPGVKRSSAYAAMASYGYPDVRLASASGLEGGDADRMLSALLSDTDAGVRRAAAMRLLELRSPLLKEAMPSLVTGSDPETARAVFEYAVAHRDADGAVETIVAAVAGPYHEMAATAADIIIEKPYSRAFPAYEALFGRGYRKKAVAEAIAGIPGGAAVDALGKVYRGSSGDEGLRLLAVESLGGRGEFALPYLEEALEDPSDDIRVAAVKSIGTLDNSKAKLDALASAMDDREPAVAHAALTALAGARSPAGASRMFAALGKVGLSDEASALIRKMMTPDLFSGASPGDIAGIIDPSARKDAVTLLVDGGCPVAVLMPFLADRSEAVRLEAVRGLSQRSGVDASYGLLLAGADTSADVRAAAGAGLNGRGTDELSNAVKLLFGRGMASPDVLRFAAGALHDAGLLHLILDGVRKDDTGRLLSVLQPLAGRRNSDDVPVLIDGLKTEDQEIRSMIVKSLSEMPPPAGSDALVGAYNRYPYMKGMVIDISAGSVNAETVLSKALSDSDPGVKLRAAARIKDLPAGPGEKLAIAAFKDPDEKVRAEAVRAAGERGYIAIISEAANDPSAYVRGGLVKVLGDRRQPEDADVLAGLARDKDGKVSRSALDVLVSEGEGVPDGVWAGLAAQGNPKSVRLAALGVITGRKDKAGMELFTASLSDPDKEISDAGKAGLMAAGKDAFQVVCGLLSGGKAVRMALDIVIKTADPSYEPVVASLMGKSVGGELTAAIRALGAVGGPDGLAALVMAYPGFGTADKVTALKSVSAMRLTGDEPGLYSLLSDALSSPEDDARFYAARAAGDKKVSAVQKRLVEAAGEESSTFVKREIALSLGILENAGREEK